jgi:hypothetical protein
MLDKGPQRARTKGAPCGVALPETVIAEAAWLANIHDNCLPGFCDAIRRLFVDSTFSDDHGAFDAVGRELADARRDILRLHRRLAKYRNLATQVDPPPKPRDLLAGVAGRCFLGPRVGALISGLGALAEHIKKQIERETGHPHKQGRRRGARGNPALSDLIFELEFTALYHNGAGYGLGHTAGTGSLIQLLNLLREYLPDGFIPKAHPISSYQAALNRARESHAWAGSLEACFDRTIW